MKTIKFHDFLAKKYEKVEYSENSCTKSDFFKDFLIILETSFFGTDIVHTVANLIKDIPIGSENSFKWYIKVT
jgi:hypothetical protein